VVHVRIAAGRDRVQSTFVACLEVTTRGVAMDERQHDGPKSGPQKPALICAERIREQLHRVLSTRDFALPKRAGLFLSYVVEEALAGRVDRIKAYSVGIEVFGRPANFDAMNDPVVRIEAGRLRLALERYYLLKGKLDPVLIEMPKGGYAPSFSLREIPDDDDVELLPQAQPRPSSSSELGRPWYKNLWLQACVAVLAISALVVMSLLFERTVPTAEAIETRPIIIVRTFKETSLSTARIASALAEEILEALSVKGDLAIFPSRVAPGPADGAAIQLRRAPQQYILDGSVREANDKIRISSRLLQSETGQIVWSNAYDADLKSSIETEVDLATKISTAVRRSVETAKAQ
jgi:TolB-like protein